MQYLILRLIHCAVLKRKKKNDILMITFSFFKTNDPITENL